MGERAIVKIIRWILGAIIFLPAVVWRDLPIDYTLFKSWLFFILVDAAFVWYLLLLARNNAYLPKKSALTALVAAFLLLHLISLLGSVDGGRSFWGTWNRSADSGFLAIVHYVMFFFVCAGALRVFEDWRWVLRVGIFAAAISAFVGLVQVFTIGGRISGTVANPIVFSAYIGMNLFLMLAIVMRSFAHTGHLASARIKPYVAVFLGGIFIVSMFLSFSRGPLLALAAMVIAAAAWSLFKNTAMRRVSGILFAAVLITGLIVLWLGESERSRFVSLDDSSVSNRLHAWKVAAVGISQKPWFGWGQENFSYAFDRNYDPSFLTSPNAETWWDRAHNVYLDTAVQAGVIGLVFFCALLVAGVVYAFRVHFFLAAAFGVYAIGGLTFFDTQATYVMLFMLLALAHAYGVRDREEKSLFLRFFLRIRKSFLFKRPSVFIRRAVSACAIIVGAAALVELFLFWRTASANYYMNNVGNLAYEQAVDSFDRSLKTVHPYRDEVRYEFANYVVNAQFMGVIPESRRNADFEFAKKEIERAARENRRDSKLQWQAARLNNVYYAFKKDPALLEDAEFFEAWGSADSPGRQQIFYEQAQTLTLRGDHQGAIRKLKEIVVLNSDFPGAWFTLGLGYLNAGDGEKGIEYVEFAQRIGHPFQQSDLVNWLAVAQAYYERKDYARTADVYRGLIEVSPNSIFLYKRLAAVYVEAEKFDDAIAMARKLAERDSSLSAEAEAFIAEVKREIQKR